MSTLSQTRNALGIELTDLHIHLGGAVAPHILWSLAHQQGFKLPVENYWEFVEFITIDPSRIQSLDDYLNYFHWTQESLKSELASVDLPKPTEAPVAAAPSSHTWLYILGAAGLLVVVAAVRRK